MGRRDPLQKTTILASTPPESVITPSVYTVLPEQQKSISNKVSAISPPEFDCLTHTNMIPPQSDPSDGSERLKHEPRREYQNRSESNRQRQAPKIRNVPVEHSRKSVREKKVRGDYGGKKIGKKDVRGEIHSVVATEKCEWKEND